jgi:hypothetical protein
MGRPPEQLQKLVCNIHGILNRPHAGKDDELDKHTVT